MTSWPRNGRVRTAIATGLLALTAISCNITRMRHDGTSMAPTIGNGERLLVTRWTGAIRRYDIITFGYPLEPSKTFLKRVIGLPGERVSSRDGRIFIDGHELAEPYLVDETYRSQDTFPEKLVPPDTYFVLGDHRNNSSDSRTWGPVPVALVRGKVLLR
jgi:signal peptidase I